MHSEDNAILLHDIRAAMLNHSGLHKEVQDSLLQLTELLHSIASSSQSVADGDCQGLADSLREQVHELLTEDIEQCMPMLQLCSEKLSTLLSTLSHEVVPRISEARPGA